MSAISYAWCDVAGRLWVSVAVPRDVLILARGEAATLWHHIEQFLAPGPDGQFRVPGIHPAASVEHAFHAARVFATRLENAGKTIHSELPRVETVP